MQLSRRRWLSRWPAALPRLLRGARAPLFEEIPPAHSGITWVHDNARSKEHYLPEALGPGCAFLDYDNDGWMDIYLVNSGPSRLLPAGEAAAQCALPEQSRRHLHRRHREGRSGRRHLRDGRRGGRLR